MAITLRTVLAWAAFGVFSLLLALFVGIAYPLLLVACLAFSASLWVTAETRWRSLLRFVWGRERSARWADAPWTLRYSLFLFAHGMVTLALAVMFLLFANIRLANLWGIT